MREIIMFTGEEFYKHFFCRFQEFKQDNIKKYNKITTDAAWTEFVKDDFLSSVANELEFNIKREGIHAIDLTWERDADNSFVAIEHENDPKGIWEDEVPNLLKSAAHLKVLITYVNDGDFPGREVAKQLFDFLKKRNFNGEFLLLLGTNSMKQPTDWTAYLYRPELTYQSLVFCSNLLEAENSPGRKAYVKRKSKKSVS